MTRRGAVPVVLVLCAAAAAFALWALLKGNPAEALVSSLSKGTREPSIARGGGAVPRRAPEPPPGAARPPVAIAPAGTTAAPEGETYRVTGVVVLADGSPAPGAAVVLRRSWEQPPGTPGVAASADATAAEPVAAPPAGASPAGLADPRPDLLRDLFHLDAERAGRLEAYCGLPAAPKTEPDAPIVGRAAAAPDGSFVASSADPGPFRVRASLPGLGAAEQGLVTADGAPIRLVLGSLADLAGIVRDADSDAPVAGARVLVHAGRAVAGARTDAEGRFLIPGLPVGGCLLEAGAPRRTPVRMEGVAVSPGGKPVEVVFPSGGATWGSALRILVTAREAVAPRRKGEKRKYRPLPDPVPVAGASVVAMHFESGSVVAGTTDAAGIARLPGLGEGTWNIRAIKEGFGVGRAEDARIESAAPGERALEVRLSRLVETPVRVVDGAGNPMRDVTVFWGGEDEAFDPRLSEAAGRTDGEGLVRVAFDEGVPRKSVLWILPPGRAANLLRPEDPSSGAEEKVVVADGRVVRGVVTDGEGAPVPGARLHLRILEEEGDQDVSLQVVADPQGAYQFPAVPFGRVVLAVDCDLDFTEAERGSSVRDDPLVIDFHLKDTWTR